MGTRPADDSLTEESLVEPVEVQITDVLDLHPFQPQDVSSVVREYLDAAYAAGLEHLRIIHGRGKGVQRETVRTLLKWDTRVADFGDAPLQAGGWGATWIAFRRATGGEQDNEG